MVATVYEHNSKVAAIHKLRVNVKSLAAEARVIRHEAERCGTVYRDALTSHRRGRLREEARYAQLALAFYRSRPYRTVEQKCFAFPDLKRLTEKVKRYDWSVKDSDVHQWLR
jgi:hypothetical protein